MASHSLAPLLPRRKPMQHTATLTTGRVCLYGWSSNECYLQIAISPLTWRFRCQTARSLRNVQIITEKLETDCTVRETSFGPVYWMR